MQHPGWQIGWLTAPPLPFQRACTPSSVPLCASALERKRRSRDRKSTRLNSSHLGISYAVFCLKKKNTQEPISNRNRTSKLANSPPTTCCNAHSQPHLSHQSRRRVSSAMCDSLYATYGDDSGHY